MRSTKILTAATAALLWSGTSAAVPSAPAEKAPAIATPGGAAATPPADTVAQLRALVAQLKTEMFQPGAKVAGWDVGGADPDRDLRTAGADSHYFLTRSSDGPGVVILTDRRIDDFAPGAWRPIDSYGSAIDHVENPFVQFMPLTPRFVMGLRGNSWRQQSVDCTRGLSHAILYEVPDAPASEKDASVPMFFRLAMLAGEEETVCSRYERDATRGGYRVHAFLPDGRALPKLDEPDYLVTIVSAAPISSLMPR